MTPAGIAPCGLEGVDLGLDGLRHGARVVAGDLTVDRRGRGLVDPGDAALDIGLLDRRDVAERDRRARSRPGRASRSSTEVVAVRVHLDDEGDGLAGLERDGRGGRRDERRADLGRDLGRGQPDRDGLVRVDRDLDLGRGLDEVALEVDDAGRVLERGQDGDRGLLDLDRVRAADDDRRAHST